MTRLYYVTFTSDDDDDDDNFDAFVEANDVEQAIRLWREFNREALDQMREEGGPLTAPDDVFLVPTLTGTESLRPWFVVGGVESVLFPGSNCEITKGESK